MQLVFNETFDKIVNESPNCYKTNEEIPRNIIDFIDNISSTRIIYNESSNEYYCTECLEKLDNFYCNYCKKHMNIIKIIYNMSLMKMILNKQSHI